MARTKKSKEPKKAKKSKARQARQFRDYDKLTYKDLKKECVIRGMPFEDLIGAGVPDLQGWLNKNLNKGVDKGLLNKYDDHVEQILESLGQQDLIHPQLRLGYLGEKDETPDPPKMKITRKATKKREARRERTDDNIFKGTKKALTFSLQAEGLEVQETVDQVLKQFPDANIKSVKIWFKKARRLHEQAN